MNKKQKILLIIASFILFLMLLFPPWHYAYRSGHSVSVGYYFILSSPEGRATINIALLLVQYLFTATIGGILYYILKDKDKNEKKDEMH